MSDLHELVLRWPHQAGKAIVTGTFDQWSGSLRMNKEDPVGFVATVRVPWDSKVLYKFIIDGVWATTDKALTEPDRDGNVNNVCYAPTKPKDTSHYEPPAAREPVISPVPASKQPIEVVTLVPPPVHPSPVPPVNGTKPVDTPPKDTPPKTKDTGNLDKKVPAVLPTPAPLFVVPVNDANTVDKRPPVVKSPDHPDAPSTHALPVNSPRKPLNGTPSLNNLPSKKEEVKQPNGTTDGDAKPAKQPPATPTKDTVPRTPTTPKNSSFPGSASSSPASSPSKKGSLKKKRDSFIEKVKHIFSHEKGEKGHHKAKSQDT